MTNKPTTAQELEELFGNVDLEQLIKDAVYKEFKEGAEEMQRQLDKHLLTTLFGRKYATKKIKRRIFYEVIWWGAESRHTKCFYSAKKMRKFVNNLHSWCDLISMSV